MPIRYLSGYETQYQAQLASDNAQDLASTYAATYASTPEIAATLSANQSRYPWLTPGVSLSLAKAGQGPESPLTQQLAQSTAERRAGKQASLTGIGVWSAPGEWVGNVFSGVGSALKWLTKPIDKPLKATTRGALAGLSAGTEAIDALARQQAADIHEKGILRGLLPGPGHGSGPLLVPNTVQEQTTLGAALQGKSLGSGYFPGGEAKDYQTNLARSVYEVDGHVGNLGRILAQTVFEPGTKPFNLLSGAVDAAKIFAADPIYLALKSSSEARAASKLIEPPAAPLTIRQSSAGLVRSSTRSTVDDNLAHAWASTGDGAKIMDDVLHDNSTWSIMKKYGWDVETSRRMADTRLPGEPLNVFQDRFLAHVLTTKPDEPSRLGIALKEHTNSIRMFQSFPRESQALASDLDQTVRLLVGHARNARLGEDAIGFWVDRLARVENNAEYGAVIKDFTEDIALRAAGQVDHTGAILGTKRKLAVGDKVYHERYPGKGEVVHMGTRDVAVTRDPGTLPFDATENFARVRFHHNGVEHFEEVAVDELSKHLPLTRARGLAAANFRGLQEDFIPEAGSGIPRTTLIKDGVVHDLSPVHPYAEYLTGTVVFPNIREIKRATSAYGRLLNNHAILGKSVDLLDLFRDIWNPVTLFRGGAVVRSLADDTLRAAASGLTSAVHPIRHIVLGLGARGDVEGHLANSEQFSQIVAHAGRGSLDRGVLYHSRVIRPADAEFAPQWADNLATMSRDPLTRKLAGNFDDVTWARTGNTLTDAQKWFWEERIPELKTLVDEASWPTYFKSRALANRHVANVHSQLEHLTRADNGLLEMVSHGTINGQPAITINPQDYASITDEARSYIRSRVGQPNMPTQVIGPRPLDAATRKKYDLSTTRLFNGLWGKPTAYFIHNPSLKDGYIQSLSESLPLMSKEGQAEALTFMRDALTESGKHAPTRALQERLARKQLQQMATYALKGTGDLTFREADAAAKIHSANRARDIFYDLHNRSQFADAFRHIFPFFDAWKDMITTWSKIAVRNPAVVRRLQTVVEGARGSDTDPESGFFHIDPSTGEEVFSFPALPFVTSQTLRAATQMQGTVAGLNMFSSTPLMPGIGPIIQMPLGRILPDRPDTDWVRKMMLPYGTPTLGSTITPPFFDKIVTAFNHDENKDRNFANSMKSAASYLMSTGEYNQSDPASMRALEDKSRKLAQSVFYFRGLFQWLSPSAPSPSWRAFDPSGNLLAQQKMSKEYHDMIDTLGSDNATAAFLNLFGTKNLLIMQEKTQGYSPSKQDTYDFMREHPQLIKDFPDAFKFFAPQNGPDSHYDAYNAAFEMGLRETLTFKEYVERANDRVASMIYYNQKDNLGPKPTKAQLNDLSQLREVLTQKFPGFDPEANDPKRRERTIAQLYAAAATNDLNYTPAGRGIAAYLSARDQAIASAARAGIKGWGSTKTTRNVRVWLRGIAEKLKSQYPGFDRAFDQVFAREMVSD